MQIMGFRFVDEQRPPDVEACCCKLRVEHEESQAGSRDL